MNPIPFTKMHGLGNDFVVFEALSRRLAFTSEQIRRLADRRFGVGCDQVLLVEPPREANTEFYYRIFNADGGEVEQCGNGARCFARFVTDRGLTRSREIPVGTRAGIIHLHLEPDGQVRVDMGRPRLEPAEIPFVAEARSVIYPLEIPGQTLSIGVISMGNPHAVLRVAEVSQARVAEWGPAIESHPRFPQRVNVGFMEVVNAEHIRLRVFERGSFETLACGTGACAAVVAGRLQGCLDARVRVSLPGGDLWITWPGEGQAVEMTGPAVTVFEGVIDL
ncbi:diaminopimelate epimerase [Gammaproteobacteria bacterium]